MSANDRGVARSSPVVAVVPAVGAPLLLGLSLLVGCAGSGEHAVRAASSGESPPRTPGPAAPAPEPMDSGDVPDPAALPTLPPAPDGAVPVFSHGPREGENAAKQVALTFDADMTRDQTDRAAAGERFDHPELVTLLRRERIPATVFMTGMWARTYPDQARAIGRDPLFEVANHTFSHYAYTADCHGLPQLDPAEFRTDVERAERALRAAGVPRVAPYLRFPGGCHDARARRALAPTGLTAVQWDVSAGDGFATDPEQVAATVLDGVRPGSVVVLHLTRSAAPVTAEAMRRIVPALRDRGYTFVRVSDLLARS